jgi:2-methylcitrate dehydratase PrpD
MSALERLGELVATMPAASEPSRELVELHVLDAVAAMIASTATAEGLRLLRFRAVMGSPSEDDLPLDLTTYCALTRLSEIDDIHLASMITPGGIVIPAALSMAQRLPHVDSADVVAAILAGYEIMTRFGRAIDGPAVLYRGIWPTYFAAPLGTAAAAARLFKFDSATSAQALALALTLAAPGVGQHHAQTTSRWFAIGAAARNGLAAAFAARRGFTSDLDLIEGNFLKGVFGITPDIGALMQERCADAALAEVSFKPWCAARQTMAATQAFKEIIDSGIAVAGIDGITAYVLPPHRKMIDHGVKPGDRASHLTSVPYCMAVAALASQELFKLAPSASVPECVAALMQKIKIENDETLLADYPGSWPARVRVNVGGVGHERTVKHIPGDPARPFDRAHVQEKFLRFASPVIGMHKSEEMLALCSDALARGNFNAVIADIEPICSTALAE